MGRVILGYQCDQNPDVDDMYCGLDDMFISSSFDRQIDCNQTIPKQIEDHFASDHSNQTTPNHVDDRCAKDTLCLTHNVIDDKSTLINCKNRNESNVTVNDCNETVNDTIESENIDCGIVNDDINIESLNKEMENVHSELEECNIRSDDETLPETNETIVEGDKKCNNIEEQLSLEQIEDIKTFINDSIHEIVTSDLELMKIQAKNEIKVAMSHKFQCVVDDNLSLKNKLTKMQTENHKLSSSLGDMKKFLNEMKEKYDAVVALNDRLQEQLDIVVEQQKEISSVGKNIQLALASPVLGINDQQLFKDEQKIDQFQNCIPKSNESTPQNQIHFAKSHNNSSRNGGENTDPKNSELNHILNTSPYQDDSLENDTQHNCEIRKQSIQTESILPLSDNVGNIVKNRSVDFLKNTRP